MTFFEKKLLKIELYFILKKRTPVQVFHQRLKMLFFTKLEKSFYLL